MMTLMTVIAGDEGGEVRPSVPVPPAQHRSQFEHTRGDAMAGRVAARRG
jgi:hypothetical protein